MNIHVNMCKPWCFFSSINGEYTNNDSMQIIKILNHTQLPDCVFIHRTICCSYYRDLRKSHRTQNVSFWISVWGLCRFITKEKKSLAFPHVCSSVSAGSWWCSLPAGGRKRHERHNGRSGSTEAHWFLQTEPAPADIDWRERVEEWESGGEVSARHRSSSTLDSGECNDSMGGFVAAFLRAGEDDRVLHQPVACGRWRWAATPTGGEAFV